ncbi:MAG: hypothetical protein HZA08_13555 [Nitrospirae bacterium]|nr:hypothetical protein [Nitrospirota bacterium]
MKLPNYENAVVPQPKITEYLLSFKHRNGRGKAQFFTRFGFSIDCWEAFAKALLEHAYNYDVTKVVKSLFGTRYVIEGLLNTPDKRNPAICLVWFIENDESIPRLVTAYLI